MSDSRSSRWRLIAFGSLALVGVAVGVWAVWFRGGARTSLNAGGSVRVVAVSPDGALIAAAGDGGGIRVWGTKFSAKFTLGGSDRVWDAAGGTKYTLEGHTGKVFGLAFSPDSKTLASCGEDRTVRLWDAVTGAPGAAIAVSEGSVECVAFSLDGKALAAAGSDGQVHIWASPSGKLVRTLKGHTRAVHALAFVPSGMMLASAGEDGGIRLWNWLTAEPLGQLPVDKRRVHALAASADGKTLAAAVTGGLRWWNVADKVERPTVSDAGGLRAVAFDREGKFLATAHEDGSVKLWSAADGAAVKTLTGHRGPVCGVGFAPDGRTLVSAGSDGTVKLWDVPAK